MTKSSLVFAACLLALAHVATPFHLDGDLKTILQMRADFPDIGLTPPEMIERVGYPAETHWVTTEDGYVLQVHRMPNPGKPVVFLQHGSLSSSADWIMMGPEKSIAYMLFDLGYDIWFGNARGNTYSKNHTTMNIEDIEFWDFSYHEMGVYDLPAVIDHILAATSSAQLNYIGHSMGTTMFWVMASEKPEYNSKIRQMHAFAPVAFMGRVRSPLLLSAVPFVWQLEWLGNMMGGMGEYMPSNEFNSIVGELMCQDGSFLQDICAMEIFMLCGYSPSQLNYTTLPLIKAFSPAGTSTKTILHFTKQVISWQFAQYDYGWIDNMVHYGQMLPPTYDLDKVTAPVYLHYTDNDLLAHPLDVNMIENRISNMVGKYHVPMTMFSHIDFMWGNDAKSLVYDLVFEQLAAN